MIWISVLHVTASNARNTKYLFLTVTSFYHYETTECDPNFPHIFAQYYTVQFYSSHALDWTVAGEVSIDVQFVGKGAYSGPHCVDSFLLRTRSVGEFSYRVSLEQNCSLYYLSSAWGVLFLFFYTVPHTSIK